MNDKQYELLYGYWKNLFDFYAIKKIDEHYLSPYKLKYNENLFKIFFKDQRQNYKRPKDNYEKIAHKIYAEAEKEIFVGSRVDINHDNILSSLNKGVSLVTSKVQSLSKFQYPKVLIKLTVPCITLNQNEMDFLSTSIPSSFSGECAYLVINYAEIPVYRKMNERKKRMLERHVKRAVVDVFNKQYDSVFNTTHYSPKLTERVLNRLERFYISYFI